MLEELKGKSILIYDIETDSLDTTKAGCKWFGAYSYITNEYYNIPYTEMDSIKKMLEDHIIIIGFNNKKYDNAVLENQHNISFSKYKNVIDLYDVSKQRLKIMGVKVPRYSLDEIVQTLGLSEKGCVDYEIFKKDEWTVDEIRKIKTYLQQDIEITRLLFEWFFKQFNPLRGFLSEKAKNQLQEVKASPASLAYRVMCNLSDKECMWSEYGKKEETKSEGYCGGHRFEVRDKKTSGNLVSVDITSAYPHMIMMGNLLSPMEDGWNGGDYFNLKGTYDNTEQGVTEKALNKVFLTRLKAKREGDKKKNLSYKIVINSFSGTVGNSKFKTFYDLNAASDFCGMTRTVIKKLAKTCEENGFRVISGFTDNVLVSIPKQSSKEELMIVVDAFVKDVKKNVPFPMDTFGLEVDKEYKFMCTFAPNHYVWVDKNDKVGYMDTVFNKNTPQIILKIFNDYMAPKMVKMLDISFTKEELEKEIRNHLKKNIELALTKYTSKELSEYKVKSSMNYQLTEMYGSGQHMLIPNSRSVGAGKDKGTKKKVGVRFCTLNEFRDNNFTNEDVDISKLIKMYDEFIKNSTGVKNERNKSKTRRTRL